MNVHILTWRYSDNSACGVVRAYTDQVDADADRKMLEDQTGGSRTYAVVEVPLVGVLVDAEVLQEKGRAH